MDRLDHLIPNFTVCVRKKHLFFIFQYLTVKKSKKEDVNPVTLEPGVRVYIVRHGESEGNLDLSAYAEHGDHAVPLTKVIIM